MSKLLLLLSSALAFLAHAASISAQTPYELLTPVGDVSGSVTPEEYIIAIYRAGIWAAAALAVVMIVWGGVQYAGSEVVTSKENAKKQIAAAIGGLVLALGAYLLLQTINPDLVNFSVDVGRVDVAVDAPAAARKFGCIPADFCKSFKGAPVNPSFCAKDGCPRGEICCSL